MPRSSAVEETPSYIKIDRTFVKKLLAKPNATTQDWINWKATYSELGYFLLAGDDDAVRATIKYILYNKQHRNDYDDHYGIQELATLLSLSPRFHSVIAKIDREECRAISNYYRDHKQDFASPVDWPWQEELCKKN